MSFEVGKFCVSSQYKEFPVWSHLYCVRLFCNGVVCSEESGRERSGLERKEGFMLTENAIVKKRKELLKW